MLGKEWEVSVEHIFREQNRVADALVKIEVSNNRLVRILETTPVSLESSIERDRVGATCARLAQVAV